MTDLTGAMISGLKKLKLKCLSDLDEHFESIYNYLGKIYEAEKNDPHFSAQSCVRSLLEDKVHSISCVRQRGG
eukprot:COSAG02_NODE_1080_length_14710_cov_46.078913_6_plen_73_part_00